MGKLDHIPKNEIFRVPEDYFEKLPGKIQSRISSRDTQKAVPVLKYAVTFCLLLLATALTILYLRPARPDVDTLLSAVETTDLIEYLQVNGLTTEELLEQAEFTAEEIEALENEIYGAALSDVESDDLVIDPEFNAEQP